MWATTLFTAISSFLTTFHFFFPILYDRSSGVICSWLLVVFAPIGGVLYGCANVVGFILRRIQDQRQRRQSVLDRVQFQQYLEQWQKVYDCQICSDDNNSRSHTPCDDGHNSSSSSLMLPCAADNNDGDSCCICLEGFVTGDQVFVSSGSCSHTFHMTCITQWSRYAVSCPISKSLRCPLCRVDWMMTANKVRPEDCAVENHTRDDGLLR